jgi:acetyl esterase/lipase
VWLMLCASLVEVVVAGESGGGNLSIATAMLARDRKLDGLCGVYAMAPFIAGMCACVMLIDDEWQAQSKRHHGMSLTATG